MMPPPHRRRDTGKLDVCGYNVVKENADTAPKGG